MKKRINLLQKKKQSGLSTLLIDSIVLYGTIVSIILFAIFLFLTFLQITLRQEKSRLIEEKTKVIETTAANQEQAAEMGFFIKKRDQLRSFLADDARFLPYYTLLQEALQPASGSAPILDKMDINKDKETEFSVRFATYEPAFEFLKYMESERFLSNFMVLNLEGFSLNSRDPGSDGGYELQFKGKFKPIEE